MNRIRSRIAAALLAAAGGVLPFASAWAADDPQVRQMNGVEYVSGGISEEERFGMDTLARNFNLKLIFATKAGAYLSDTDVVVTNNRRQPVLQVRSDGPWFFARLPAGQYQVMVSSNGRSQGRSVTLGSRGVRTLNFRWDSLEEPRVRP